MENLLEIKGKTGEIVEMLIALSAWVGSEDFLFDSPILTFRKDPKKITTTHPSTNGTSFVIFEYNGESKDKAIDWEQKEDTVELVVDCNKLLKQMGGSGMGWGADTETQLIWDGTKLTLINETAGDISESYPVDIEQSRGADLPVKIEDFKPKFKCPEDMKLNTGKLITHTTELAVMKKRADLADVNMFLFDCNKEKCTIIVGGVKSKSNKITHKLNMEKTQYKGKAMHMVFGEQFQNIFGSIKGKIATIITRRSDGLIYPFWIYTETENWRRGNMVSPIEEQ